MEIYAIGPNAIVNQNIYGEPHNAFGGAIHIWTTLGEKYGTNFSLFNPDPTWKAIDRMEERDRWAMGFTFDMVVVRKSELPTLIRHLVSFAKDYPTPTLDECIDVLRRARNDSNVEAVCFNHTSVSESPWVVYDSDDECDEGRGFDLNKDKGAWYLTEESIRREEAMEYQNQEKGPF
jgi:hypothetical protein